MIFSDRECNYPLKTFGYWWLSQFRRWGMVKEAPDYAGIVKKVIRQDIYLDAMKDMGVTPKGKGHGAGEDVRRHVRSEPGGEVRAVVPSPQPRVTEELNNE